MSQDQFSYDTIIIGTSPLAITEAVFQKKQGKSVLNVDNRSVLGGAWATISHDGIPEVEIGCHIWEVEKSATTFLTKFFQLDLRPLKPSPRLYKKGIAIPYDLKINISTTKYLLSKIARLKFKEIGPGMRSPANRFSIAPSKYLYPKGGAKELHMRVIEKVQQEELQSKLNTTIDSIKLTHDGCLLEIRDEATSMECSQLIITSLSDIQRIEFEDGSEILPKTKQVDYTHLHILVSGSIPKAFSYHRLMDDDIIHRVSDMTIQVKDEIKANQHLICVGIHSSAYHYSIHEELVRSIFDKLVARKLLSADTTIDMHGFNVFPSYYTNADLLSEIEQRSNGKISVLRSTNFTFAFHNRLKDYETLI